MITIEGHLERITYTNEENHYTIARFKTGHPSSQITVVGYMAGIRPGQGLKVTGSWENHPKYGPQFKTSSYEVTLPETIDGIRKYLESGLIKGIGPIMASRLIAHFKSKTLEIIEKTPRRLTEVAGIGNAKAALITASWKKHHYINALMDYLQSHGVKISYGAKILKAYGEEAIHIMETHPFRLAEDIPGVGFLIADTISQSRGMPANDPNRIKACIRHLIQQSARDGHTFLPENLLLQYCADTFRLDLDDVQKALHTLGVSNDVVLVQPDDPNEPQAIYSKDMHLAETGLAKRLKALLSVPAALPEMDPEQLSHNVLKKIAIKLSPEQLHALESILTRRVAILTGGPGTGKTTLIRAINATFEALGKKVVLAAPTGRAARRLSEIVNKEAKTIHRLLGYNFRDDSFEKNPGNPIDADTIIVDEASMVDTVLMYHLIKAVPLTSILILVGDVFQLPSVGPGNVLKDIIASETVPVFYLTTIFRQARESPIIINAHMIREGEFPDLNPRESGEELSEFYFIEKHTPEAVVATIVKLCSRSIPDRFYLDSMKEIQVLTPMHKGEVGTLNLNKVLQQVLNKNPTRLKGLGYVYKIGDKVMHLKNNYQKDVFNGDIGIVDAIDEETREVAVDYDGRTVIYEPEEMDELSLAYAISIHKSQGSEYPAVVVPLMTQHYALLQRNLLYTAITRGKNLVVLVGTKKAFAIALNNDKPRNRFSGLDQKLRKA